MESDINHIASKIFLPYLTKFLITFIHNILQFHVVSGMVMPIFGLPRCLSAIQKLWILSPDWGDSLEKGMAIHCSVLAWRIPWTEALRGLHTVQQGGKEQDTTEATECACMPMFILIHHSKMNNNCFLIRKKFKTNLQL